MPKTSGSFFQPVAYWLFRSEMPSNVEIKARVSNATRLAERASQLSQSEGTVIRQQDTFFNCSTGRLKLRNLMDGSGQLIFYERPDCDGPKVSNYSLSTTQDPEGLRVVLREDQRPEEGEAIARSLMKELGVGNDSLVTGAYVDLLLEGQG
ncbi:uncharacterized protein LOC118947720 isoform X8 [Oncorhynchus mykiss]|uniref:uncharacterized protein LOC118947679 isoform X8 n=1 Tax=Oncorhynchus mykiss TaxID=8022 RepID=UPI001877FAE4|nr:uncharacterized protein LOC118947679 isoform X8 [Oncorhynchus mykiss]XP_036828656.1 uncharacterized protein LOC118947720 isoform X8 [Oncorhynchus mykiss]